MKHVKSEKFTEKMMICKCITSSSATSPAPSRAKPKVSSNYHFSPPPFHYHQLKVISSSNSLDMPPIDEASVIKDMKGAAVAYVIDLLSVLATFVKACY
ncbi:hypothetical protein MKW98_004254 [Papaver atlanticum]|uniref:Uncharacterized protein n=1 Tax=Papaver atlanticum TaxID=357466 RepID=A0AAD4XQG4_9MAGN|nr:hypothetical protein MKW98_004254 [Papaver atlanticum]